MDKRTQTLYTIPDIAEYEDVCLQTLRENCIALEEQLRDMQTRLPERDRQIIEAYLEMRDELEFQSIKTALRWGKRHYK